MDKCSHDVRWVKKGLLKTLMKLGGIVAIPFGTVFVAAGAYGLAGGTGIRFTINERIVSPQEGGQIFSIVGIIMLLGGIILAHISFKFSRVTILSLVLGTCSLIIPAPLLGMGYSLVASIVALVFGCSFLAMMSYWLSKFASAPLTTTEKIKIALFEGSIVFLTVYGLFSPAIFSFANSTPERWFILSKLFVATLTITITTLMIITFDSLISLLTS